MNCSAIKSLLLPGASQSKRDAAKEPPVTLSSQNDRGDGLANILCLTLLCPNALEDALARSLELVHRLVGLYHVNNKQRQGANMNKAGFATVNPSTGEAIETFSYFTPEQTEKVVASADKSFQSFRKLSVHKRAQLFADLGNTLRKNKAQLAKVISMEMGKIFSEAEAEIEKCAHEADWYAEHGPKIMADEPAPTGTVNAYVSYLPLGPILAIMPWNFPIWQLTRMAIPTLLAGNVVLVKHSSNTQGSSLEFERVMLEAGFPEGVFQNLILKRDDVVNVINDGRVQGASVTGSVRAGSAVASEAGKVIKKTVMELGGSDAFIVCEDAANWPIAYSSRFVGVVTSCKVC